MNSLSNQSTISQTSFGQGTSPVLKKQEIEISEITATLEKQTLEEGKGKLLLNVDKINSIAKVMREQILDFFDLKSLVMLRLVSKQFNKEISASLIIEINKVFQLLITIKGNINPKSDALLLETFAEVERSEEWVDPNKNPIQEFGIKGEEIKKYYILILGEAQVKISSPPTCRLNWKFSSFGNIIEYASIRKEWKDLLRKETEEFNTETIGKLLNGPIYKKALGYNDKTFMDSLKISEEEGLPVVIS